MAAEARQVRRVMEVLLASGSEFGCIDRFVASRSFVCGQSAQTRLAFARDPCPPTCPTPTGWRSPATAGTLDLKIAGVAQRGVEHAAALVGVGPGHRLLRVLVRPAARQAATVAPLGQRPLAIDPARAVELRRPRLAGSDGLAPRGRSTRRSRSPATWDCSPGSCSPAPPGRSGPRRRSPAAGPFGLERHHAGPQGHQRLAGAEVPLQVVHLHDRQAPPAHAQHQQIGVVQRPPAPGCRRARCPPARWRPGTCSGTRPPDIAWRKLPAASAAMSYSCLGGDEDDVRPRVGGVRRPCRPRPATAGFRSSGARNCSMCRCTRAVPPAGVKFRSLRALGVQPVGRDRFDQVRHHDRPQAVALHVAQAHAAVLHAHVAGHAHVEQRVDAALGAQVQQFPAVVAVADQVAARRSSRSGCCRVQTPCRRLAGLVRAAFAAVGRARGRRRVEADRLRLRVLRARPASPCAAGSPGRSRRRRRGRRRLACPACRAASSVRFIRGTRLATRAV